MLGIFPKNQPEEAFGLDSVSVSIDEEEVLFCSKSVPPFPNEGGNLFFM